MRKKSRERAKESAGACVNGKQDGASFQVIVLGASGGPREDTTTGLLVRSTASEWRKGSIVAVDAGAHLAKIVRILEDEHGLPGNSDSIPPEGYSKPLTNGPFAGIRCPAISAKANALYIFRELLHSFLITHPHLDHISGMAVNTPALEFGREPKAIVALPSTIDAIKHHIFNDVIWPNLSDEGDGVGFVTYRRLIEGGNPRLGSGEGRGYVNVCDGLATKCWSISHGRCNRHRRSLSHHHDPSFSIGPDGYPFPPRRFSHASDGYANAGGAAPHHMVVPGPGSRPVFPQTPGALAHGDGADATAHSQAVDSSVFFIRNDSDDQEIIVFGDIEPDSLSLLPRNQAVWDDAAAKIAAGRLKAIFIECSYDDSARDQDLYGHLCPRHLIAELSVLAGKVVAYRQNSGGGGSGGTANLVQQAPSPEMVKKEKKRKRNSQADGGPPPPASSNNGPTPSVPAPATALDPSNPSRNGDHHHHRTRRNRTRTSTTTPTTSHDASASASVSASASIPPPPPPPRTLSPPPAPPSAPLTGLTIHIIHVKDTFVDGRPQSELIQQQLVDAGKVAGLGCAFDVTVDGQSIYI